MEWISIKDKLPPLEERVLIHGEWGFKIQPQIGTLYDMNGKDGYNEYTGIGGMTIRIPNKPTPDLKWNLYGHWREFNLFTHWMPLPPPPIE